MKKPNLAARILALFLTLVMGLPSPAFALRRMEPVQSGAEEPLAEELQRNRLGETILEYAFPPVESPGEALALYDQFRTGALIPFFDRWLDPESRDRFFRTGSGSPEKGLQEAVLNLAEHGRGGLLEIHLRAKEGETPVLQVRLIDEGPGIADPNVPLLRSMDAHSGIRSGEEGEDSYRGYGFKNIAVSADRIGIDCQGQSLGTHPSGEAGETGILSVGRKRKRERDRPHDDLRNPLLRPSRCASRRGGENSPRRQASVGFG